MTLVYNGLERLQKCPDLNCDTLNILDRYHVPQTLHVY